jgi:hypothetical protein
MELIYVQFADETEEVIISYFAAPQNPVMFPNQAAIYTNDPRWKVYYDKLPDEVKVTFPAPV